jgi:hypothetical protein
MACERARSGKRSKKERQKVKSSKLVIQTSKLSPFLRGERAARMHRQQQQQPVTPAAVQAVQAVQAVHAAAAVHALFHSL